MALIKLSSLGITNLSGKAGGSVYAHNRGGSYVRNFAVPSNPQTQAQAQARAQFGAFASNWRNLTEEQRTAWIDAAKDFPYVDRFGDERTMSGENLYISLNRNLQLLGNSSIDNPPSPAGVNGIVGAEPALELANGGGSFASGYSAGVLVDPNVATTEYAIYATVPVSAGVNYVKNRFRLIGSQDRAAFLASSGVGLSTLYSSVFPLPADGAKIFFRFDPINSTTGERGASFQKSLIVTEAAV